MRDLISKAVDALDVVRQAATEGIVALHPSSSTYFIVEEITGEKPNTDYWVCGVVTQRGMCLEKAMALGDGYTPEKVSSDPRDLRACWIIKNKKLEPGAITLVIKGNDDQVRKAMKYVEQSKGARFPPVRLCSCDECPVPHCRFPVRDKPWTVT